jgi:hypothetical protein
LISAPSVFGVAPDPISPDSKPMPCRLQTEKRAPGCG